MLKPFPYIYCLVLVMLLSCQNRNQNPFQEIANQTIPEFQLAEGFQIELIAAEPLISDPVAMEIDEFGRLFVVEMPGYPLDISRTGKVKRLIDTDQDGFPDKSVVFADSLTLPTSIMRWKEGFIVTDAPDVLYLADTNGDDRADIREVMLTGFALSNPQHNVNSPVFGLDNWVYVANEYHIRTKSYQEEFGDEGGEVYFPKNPNGIRLPKNASARSIRFKPDTYELELQSSRSQFGHTFDPWGHYFQVSNAEPLFHEVIAAPYLARNPKLLISKATQYLPSNNPAEVFPITQNPEHQLLTDVGIFTSACGINWYSGGAFPEEYNDVVFVAEPVHNLIQANYIEPKGATFSSKPLLDKTEFLASKDSWFRPVFSYIGPDGALYVVDYYRKIIEHPEWMADEVNESGAFYEGTDKGRIYRISPRGSSGMGWIDQLQMVHNSGLGLTKTLENPNIWWRRNAHRLLVDRDNKDDSEHLSDLIKLGNSAYGRVHALWALHALNRLDPVLIDLTLKDQEAGVRENAIRLAELYMARYPALLSQMLGMAGEKNPRVRFQLLCTLGNTNNERANVIRQYLLDRDIDDPWTHIAALTAISGVEFETFNHLISNWKEEPSKGRASFLTKLTSLIARNNKIQEIGELINLCVQSDSVDFWWQKAALEGLTEGITQTNDFAISNYSKNQIISLLQSSDAQIRIAAVKLSEQLTLHIPNRIISLAQSQANNPDISETQRINAINILRISNAKRYFDTFKALIIPQSTTPIQKASLDGMADADEVQMITFVLEKWSTLSPEIRDDALALSMKSDKSIHLVLDALQAGSINPSNLGWRRTFRLMNHGNEVVKKKARTLLADAFRNRGEALEAFKPSLSLTGISQNGQKIYTTQCMTCHKMGDLGEIQYGPDLASVRNRSKIALMKDIIMPNHSIADGFELWNIELENGETIRGIIQEETPNSITLSDLAGKITTIARAEIQSLNASPQSAMPVGLESAMSHQDMADLLAFLKGEE